MARSKNKKQLNRPLRYLLAKCGYFGSLEIRPELEEVRREVELGRAIIDMALYDLSDGDAKIREDAEYWFTPRNPDFCLICQLADLNPKEVYAFVKDNWSTLREPLQEQKRKFRASKQSKK